MTGSPMERELVPWLFKDVPLRTYYKEVSELAYMGYAQEMEEENYFEDHDPNRHIDFDGVWLGLNRDMFRGLPNIRLFRGLGGYNRPSYYFWGNY